MNSIYSLSDWQMDKIDTSEKWENLKPGRILHMNGYNDPDYVVIRQLRPNLYETINLVDFKYHRNDTVGLKHISEKVDDRISVYVTDEVYTADQILDAIEKVKLADIRRDQEVEQKKVDEAEEHKKLLNDYKHLELADSEKYNYRVVGARNIRKELKKAFPGIKFSVRSSSFSMGDSIDVSWKDEKILNKAVQAITDKYQKGYFDSMEDIYEYGRDQFNTLFGGAKYVVAQQSRY